MIFTNTLFHTFIPGSFPPQPMRTCVYVFFCVCVCVCVIPGVTPVHPTEKRQEEGRPDGLKRKRTQKDGLRL